MTTRAHWIRSLTILTVLGLAGCASGIPEAIREAPPASPTLAQVNQQPPAYLGQRVRWGGKILGVSNEPTSTDIVLLAHPLDAYGEPRSYEKGEGRFIARFKGFRDPADYPTDRDLTVAGILTGSETRRVGDFPYDYPVVTVDQDYLWSEPPTAVIYPAPYGYPWYDPWYDPWYLPYPVLWHHHPRHRH